MNIYMRFHDLVLLKASAACTPAATIPTLFADVICPVVVIYENFEVLLKLYDITWKRSRQIKMLEARERDRKAAACTERQREFQDPPYNIKV
ncbi:hypothetical protein E2C01_036214 [Portunus trituberculatus]|uniref:Uncharacterized protein n=1 Tax=Portunus trituberculatus TaxID=210409 RepID=A0A5B7F675_PORTR|nr:hypothetical protein [Portunus trituberculatus]